MLPGANVRHGTCLLADLAFATGRRPAFRRPSFRREQWLPFVKMATVGGDKSESHQKMVI
jgi:hypothetical protein